MPSAEFRSDIREKARTKELLQRLQPTTIQRTVDRMDELEIKVRSQWKGNQEPIAFDVFCKELDGEPMFDRQVDAFEISDILRASNLLNAQRTISELVLIWGKGSIGSATLLRDEATGRTQSAREWEQSGEPLTVSSIVNGKIVSMQASPVYCKGSVPLLRVSLADGRWVDVSPDHKFLTPQGWLKATELNCRTSAVACAPRHGEACGREHRRTVADSQCDCRSCRHCGDEPVPGDPGCDQGAAPLRGDARNSDRVSPREDGPDSLRACSAGVGLASRPRNLSDEYQPLVRVGNGEYSLPGLHISPATRRVIDLYCSLRPPEKVQILGAFSDLASAPNEDARRSRSAAFFEVSSGMMSRALRRSAWQLNRRRSADGSGQHPNSSCASRSPVDGIVWTHIVSIIPQTSDKIYSLTVPISHNYFDANGVLHHNSGKDYLAAKLIAYMGYVVLHLEEDPATYFSRLKDIRLAPGSRIDIMNIAPTAKQALTVFFHYLKGFLSSPLFKPFPSVANSEMVRFLDIPLYLHSLPATGATTEGKNLLAYVMDEADAFRDKLGNSNAEQLHNILRSSSYTRFRSLGLGVVITYPRTETGFALRLAERGKKNPELFFVDVAGTAEIRPDFDMNDPQIVEEFENDPADANAKYNCIPMPGEGTFFERAELVTECVDDDRRCVVEIEEKDLSFDLQGGGADEYVSVLAHNIRREPGHTYCLAIDAAENGDSYAVACWHVDAVSDSAEWVCPMCGQEEGILSASRYNRIGMSPPPVGPTEVRCGICHKLPMIITPVAGVRGWWQREMASADTIEINGRRFPLPHLYEDFVVDVQPGKPKRQGGPKIPVHFPAMEAFAHQVLVGLQCQFMRCDPWQTVQMIQGLRSTTGKDVQKMSQSAPDQFQRARLAKTLLNHRMLTFRPHEKRDLEWKRLLRKNTSVNHPQGGSKDLYDAETMAIWTLAIHVNPDLEFQFS